MLNEITATMRDFFRVSSGWKLVIILLLLLIVISGIYLSYPYRQATSLTNISLKIKNLERFHNLPEAIRPDTEVLKAEAERIVLEQSQMGQEVATLSAREIYQYFTTKSRLKYVYMLAAYLVLLLINLIAGGREENWRGVLVGWFMLFIINFIWAYFMPVLSSTTLSILLVNVPFILFLIYAVSRQIRQRFSS